MQKWKMTPQNISPGVSDRCKNNFMDLYHKNNALPSSLQSFQINYCLPRKEILTPHCQKPKCQICETPLNNFLNYVFYRGISDYFESTNILYEDAGHNSINFINKY